MGLRLQCTFYAESGEDYTMSVYDEAYAASTVDFETNQDGFVITYDGTADKLKNTILGSKCSITINVDSAALETFIEDLNTAYEGQMRMKITKNGGTEGVWYGHVLYDAIQIEDKPVENEYYFNLVATDGIKRLQNIAYKDTSDAYYGYESITQHLVNCITFIGVDDLMTEEAGVLKSVTNWRPSNRIAGDDMDHIYFDHRALYQIDDRGNKKYQSVYRIIEQLCLRFHARFMMADGWYWFIQHNEYENATISPDEYTSAKVALGSTPVNSYVTADTTFTGKHGNGFYSFFPPLNIAEVNYIHFGYVNIAKGYKWDQAAQPIVPEAPTIYRTGANTSFFIKANLRFTLTYTGNRPYYLKFKINLSVGSQWLKRAGTAANPIYYGQQTIEGTNSDYEIIFPTNLVDAYAYGEGRETITVTSIEFPLEGEVLFTMNLIGAYDQQGNLVTGVTTFWAFTEVDCNVLPSGDNFNWTNTRKYTAYNTTTGNSVKETVNVIIGEDFGFGTLRIDTATVQENGNDWGVGATAAGVTIEELLAKEMVRSQGVPIRRMSMRYENSAYNVTKAIRHTPSGAGSPNTWIFHRGRWIARYEIFDGDWYILDTTGTSSNDTEEDWILDEIDTDTGNDVNPANPIDQGGPPNPTGDPTGDPQEPGVTSVIDALFPRTTADIDLGDTVTQIPIGTRGVDGEYKVGQTVTIINPTTGAQQDFVITQESATGDVFLNVTSDIADFDFATGSWIVTSQEQNFTFSGSTSFFREEFAAHASATITVTANSGNIPTNAAAIRLYYDNGQIISPNYWSHSGSVITLTYTPNGAQSIWVEFNV